MKNSSKKILAVLVVLMLSISMCFATSAATVTTNGGTDAGAAKATYIPSPDVYSVNITWGALTYTYTQTWHTDTRTNSYAWASTAPGSADKISIANSSNVPVKASFTYKEDATVTGVKGAFSNPSISAVKPAEGAAATSANTNLTLSGTPNTTALTTTTVGSITVTIQKGA